MAWRYSVVLCIWVYLMAPNVSGYRSLTRGTFCSRLQRMHNLSGQKYESESGVRESGPGIPWPGWKTVCKHTSQLVFSSALYLSSIKPVTARAFGKVSESRVQGNNVARKGYVAKGKQDNTGNARAAVNRLAKVSVAVVSDTTAEEKNKQLTRFGLLMVALSIVYGFWPTGKPRNGNGRSAPGAGSPGKNGLDDEENRYSDGFIPTRRSGRPISMERVDEVSRNRNGNPKITSQSFRAKNVAPDERRNAQKSTGEVRSLPPMGEEDTAFSSSGSKKKAKPRRNSSQPPVVTPVPAAALPRLPLGETEPREAPAPAEQPSSAPPSQPSASPLPPPQTPSKSSSMGFLNRLFQKPGGGRPAEIAQALRPGKDSQNADGERTYRALCAQALVDTLPAASFSAEVVRDVMGAVGQADITDTNIPAGAGVVVGAEELQRIVQKAGMGSAQAAEAFADVTNALLVSLVDDGVRAAEAGDAAGALSAMQKVAEFTVHSGKLFHALTPGASVQPIQYNGKARAGKLEDLYYRYAKAETGLGSIQSLLAGDAGEGSADVGALQETAEERQERLGSLQYLFNIKEGRRSSIEQRIQREGMMEMVRAMQDGAGESGWGGDELAQMLDNMLGRGTATGVGAGGGPGDEAALSDKMQKEMADLGIPDLSKMDPAEVAAMSKQALQSVKEALREGKMTRRDVEEFERAMGVKVKDLLGAVDRARASREQLGPDMAEMVDIFRELVKIK